MTQLKGMDGKTYNVAIGKPMQLGEPGATVYRVDTGECLMVQDVSAEDKTGNWMCEHPDGRIEGVRVGLIRCQAASVDGEPF